MRIGIEAQRIFRNKKHGMDIVVLELIRALMQQDTVNEYFIFVKAGEDRNCLPAAPNFHIIEVPGITYADWEQIFLPIYARKYQLDVLHCSSNTQPVFYRGKTVLTLHDVIFLEKNYRQKTSSFYQRLGGWYRKLVVPAIVHRSSHVITVSHFEKQRIQEVLHMQEAGISVVYNAFGEQFSKPLSNDEIVQVREKYHLPEKFIFYIGNTDPKKNFANTLKAYKIYCLHAMDPLPLVIADVEEKFLNEILTETKTKLIRHRIIKCDYINNRDLPAIYQAAAFFLYPSLRESFGIPVLESMASGTPVITSNISALPEISGNAAMLVDPHDAANIAKAMIQISSDQVYADELRRRGDIQSKQFNWHRSAEQVLKIYQSI